MTEGASGIGDWIVICAVATGLGILGLMIAIMGGLALTYLIKLLADIWRYGL